MHTFPNLEDGEQSTVLTKYTHPVTYNNP